MEIDPKTKGPKKSNEVVLRDWSKKTKVKAERMHYTVEFTVRADFGFPRAITMANKHQRVLPRDHDDRGVPCNSWVHAWKDHPRKRIFFSNQVLPSGIRIGVCDCPPPPAAVPLGILLDLNGIEFDSSEVVLAERESVLEFVLEHRPCGLLKSRKNFRSASFMFNLLNLKGLSWGFGSDGQEKVELTAAELESLQSQLADLEEREAHLRAQLEHVDEILRSSRLSGYLYVRTRWAALPGEPPPIDDGEVDDWLPRFVVLHGSCIFFYLLCTDISPQDSSLLSDIVEVESLPSFTREDETYHAFSIMTRQGLRYECSCASDIQVKSWLTELEGQ